MRTYTCYCGNTLYFDNTLCLQCGRTLGFDPQQLSIVALDDVLDEKSPALYRAAGEQGITYKKCENYNTANVCNWLLHSDDERNFCLACNLNSIIPDLSSEQNRERWYKLEKAKRRLIYTLLSLNLTVTSFRDDPEHGLAFRFMEDIKEIDPYSDEVVTYEQIMTGHQAGVITINTIEADDSAREQIRENMNEAYRTLLGHFRHESGHYYWDQFLARNQELELFRHLFGDERNDYKESLKRYYQYGPANGWMNNYISPYASAHPWEDWAETWAHYLHFIDTLETASHYHVGVEGEEFIQSEGSVQQWLPQLDFDQMIRRLATLIRMLNELNRSLGIPDPYPFELSPVVIEKLAFIHRLVLQNAK
ncbi:zinc-binding metallopeptidase family protein [Kaarinaea lacus]